MVAQQVELPRLPQKTDYLSDHWTHLWDLSKASVSMHRDGGKSCGRTF